MSSAVNFSPPGTRTGGSSVTSRPQQKTSPLVVRPQLTTPPVVTETKCRTTAEMEAVPTTGSLVAEIVAEPSPRAEITPAASTATAVGLELDQLTARVRLSPAAEVTVALRESVCSNTIVALAGETAIE